MIDSEYQINNTVGPTHNINCAQSYLKISGGGSVFDYVVDFMYNLSELDA